MNIEELLQSGTIELYVLNALPPEEAAEVELWAQQYPEVKAEIEETESVLQLFAQAHAVSPPDFLRDSVLDKIENDKTPPQSNTEQKPKQPESVEKPIDSAPEISAQITDSQTVTENFDSEVLPTNRFGFLGKLLPWVVAAGLAGGVFYFYQKNIKAETELKKCKKNQEEMINTQKLIIAMQQKMDVITNPKTRQIELKGLAAAPKARATVYWNPEREATYLAIQNLPPLPPDKQYQLWGIVNKNPVDAGIFDLDLANVQPMKAFDTVNAFAVTIEPLGGSPTPTLDKMVVLGTL